MPGTTGSRRPTPPLLRSPILTAPASCTCSKMSGAEQPTARSCTTTSASARWSSTSEEGQPASWRAGGTPRSSPCRWRERSPGTCPGQARGRYSARSWATTNAASSSGARHSCSALGRPTASTGPAACTESARGRQDRKPQPGNPVTRQRRPGTGRARERHERGDSARGATRSSSDHPAGVERSRDQPPPTEGDGHPIAAVTARQIASKVSGAALPT